MCSSGSRFEEGYVGEKVVDSVMTVHGEGCLRTWDRFLEGGFLRERVWERRRMRESEEGLTFA